MTTTALSQAQPAIDEHDPPGFARTFAITCAILCPLSFIAGTLLSYANDMDLAGSIGFGIFVALSAGFGFALMLGGAIYASKAEEHEHPAPEGSSGQR